MHKLVLKSNKVVEMVMTTKDEGMKNEVEAMKNREVEARTKGKRKGGGGGMWKEKSSSKKRPKNIRSI
jgi:hypothetical protein